jgi:hypothetical protein
MTDAMLEASRSGTKPCKVCGEQIKAAARKCIHCDSYQDWHADINFSSTFLSLLVALVSVVATATPVLQAAFTPKNSALSFSFQGATTDLLSVLVTNQGARPGSIGNLAILTATDTEAGSSVVIALTISGASPTAAILIEPSKSTLINYEKESADLSDNALFTSAAQKVKCMLEITNTDFRANSLKTSVAVDCDLIKWWIYARM